MVAVGYEEEVNGKLCVMDVHVREISSYWWWIRMMFGDT